MLVKILTQRKIYYGLILILVGFLVFSTYQTASAVLVTINKTDVSVDEWFTQGVPLFYTDPAGDVANPDEDMLNAWVASGDDSTLNFLMELNADTAMQTQLRHAAAYIDCDMDGVPGEADDIIITYEPYQNQVWILTGDQNQGASYNTGVNRGQRVGEYLEWGIQQVIIGFINSDCIDEEVNIGFFTASTEAGFPGVPIDGMDGSGILWSGFNVPTNIDLAEFNANSTGSNSSIIFPIAGSIFILGLLGLVIFLRHRTMTKQHDVG